MNRRNFFRALPLLATIGTLKLDAKPLPKKFGYFDVEPDGTIYLTLREVVTPSIHTPECKELRLNCGWPK